MTDDPRTPRGAVITRTAAMPADTNPNGDIFGGWIMSQMDIAGAILAKHVSKKRVVTVAADAMHFICPVRVGDAVTCYGEILKTGTTSISLRIEIWANRPTADSVEEHECVTEAEFVYVAVDESGRPVNVAGQ
jgi:acyl-CoA thioesterase YciA